MDWRGKQIHHNLAQSQSHHTCNSVLFSAPSTIPARWKTPSPVPDTEKGAPPPLYSTKALAEAELNTGRRNAPSAGIHLTRPRNHAVQFKKTCKYFRGTSCLRKRKNQSAENKISNWRPHSQLCHSDNRAQLL